MAAFHVVTALFHSVVCIFLAAGEGEVGFRGDNWLQHTTGLTDTGDTTIKFSFKVNKNTNILCYYITNKNCHKIEIFILHKIYYRNSILFT